MKMFPEIMGFFVAIVIVTLINWLFPNHTALEFFLLLVAGAFIASIPYGGLLYFLSTKGIKFD